MEQVKYIALLVISIAVAGCGQAVRSPETPVGPHFRILTYNANWGGPGAEQAVRAISSADADIVCLQETHPAWQKLIRARLARQYTFMAFQHPPGLRGAGGMAFLSKFPGEQAAYVPSVTGWFDGWIAKFQTPAGPVQVNNVHLRPKLSDRAGLTLSAYFGTGDDRQREVERYYTQLEPGVPAIVAGDFNEDDKGTAVKWLRKKGFADALPLFDRKTKTWHWKAGPFNLADRFDHIMYTRDLHCYSARVLQEGSSDHYPVTAVFGLDPEQQRENEPPRFRQRNVSEDSPER